MPFPKDALTIILAYITKHEGTLGGVLSAVLAILQWLATTFAPTPAGKAKAVGFAFPTWLLPILLQLLEQLFKPKTMAAAKLPKASPKATAAANKLAAYIDCGGKAA